MFEQVFHWWERKLARKDTNRRVRPFEWGIEHLTAGANSTDPRDFLQRFIAESVSGSDRFFQPRTLTESEYSDGVLRFPSPIQSPFAENNTVYGRFFPANSTNRAVGVLPQWNADSQGHVGLCHLLNRFGISALRLSLPYHDARKPPHLERSDYLVSPNIGLTIQACRQSVLECRIAAEWLMARGYQAIGIIGTSVGSCIAFLTFAHDERFQVGVFNHVSSYFADAVWTGLTTQHVRQGIEPVLSLDELRRYWSIISPQTFVHRLQRTTRKGLLISARYDLSFLPYLTEQLIEEMNRWRVPFDRALIPCGHYTIGRFPFKYLDGYLIANYFRKHLLRE